jgi:mono/diheme cytochrome c family protein
MIRAAANLMPIRSRTKICSKHDEYHVEICVGARRWGTMRFRFLTAALVALPPTAFAFQDLASTLASQQLVRTGRDVFLANCSGCHGTNADGKGPASPMLSPRPRNLVSGSFKFRSTPSGTLPTAQDLLRTLDQGVLGTSMPSFRLMNMQEKLALVSFIMSLRPDWRETQGSPLPIPEPPSTIFASREGLRTAARRGQKTFQAACQTCHGDQGLGDGPGSAGLTDGEEQPIRPANLQRKYQKSGRSARDIFKDISTGLDGTPMPGFADTFSEADRWDLVAFVFHLRGVGAGLYQASDLAEAPAPATPAAPAKNAPPAAAGAVWK